MCENHGLLEMSYCSLRDGVAQFLPRRVFIELMKRLALCVLAATESKTHVPYPFLFHPYFPASIPNSIPYPFPDPGMSF